MSTSRLDINPNLWGPSYWRFLHSMADAAPDVPTAEERRAYESVIDALPVLLPCTKCRGHLAKAYSDAGLKPEYVDRESLKRGFHALHNSVNERLGKAIVGFDCCSKSYLERGGGSQTLVLCLIAAIVVASLILLAYLCSKKMS